MRLSCVTFRECSHDCVSILASISNLIFPRHDLCNLFQSQRVLGGGCTLNISYIKGRFPPNLVVLSNHFSTYLRVISRKKNKEKTSLLSSSQHQSHGGTSPDRPSCSRQKLTSATEGFGGSFSSWDLMLGGL